MSNSATTFRQNGKPLLITRTKLEHQRRQLQRASERAARRLVHGIPCNCIYCTFDATYQRYFALGGKGLERQLETQ